MKKLLIFLLIAVGAAYYVRQNVNPQSILGFAKKQDDLIWSPKIEYYLGVYQYTQNEYNGAAAAFTQLLTDYPSSYYAPEARIKLGMTYDADFKKGESMEQYKKYLEDYPNGPSASMARKNIELLQNR